MRLTPFGGLAATALLFFALPNCSSSDNGSGGVCGQYVDSLASFYNRCGQTSSSVLITNARDRFILACSNALAAPGASNFGGALQQCASSYGSLDCNADADCGDDVTGTLADGTACGEDYQCASGDCDAKDNGCGHCVARVPVGQTCTDSRKCVKGADCVFSSSDSGTCTTRTKLAAGGDCGVSNTECDTGLHCNYADPSKPVCAANAGAGGACESSEDCLSTLRCKDKVCGTGANEGEDCGTSFDGCANGLSCDVTTKKCVKATFVGSGQPCDDMSRVCSRGRCKGASYSSGTGGEVTVTPGTCEDPLPDGAACQKEVNYDPSNPSGSSDPPTEPQKCDTLAECVDGTCQVSNPSKCQ